MDSKVFFLLIIIIGSCLSQRRIWPGFDRCPPPTGPGVCASNCRPGFYDRCRRTGLLCCRNGCGAYQCTRPGGPSTGVPQIPVPNGVDAGQTPCSTEPDLDLYCIKSLTFFGTPAWCPPGSPRIRCFVNPCSIMTCPRFPFARCRPTNPCEPACTGAFFVWGRRIPSWLCNSRRGGLV